MKLSVGSKLFDLTLFSVLRRVNLSTVHTSFISSYPGAECKHCLCPHYAVCLCVSCWALSAWAACLDWLPIRTVWIYKFVFFDSPMLMYVCVCVRVSICLLFVSIVMWTCIIGACLYWHPRQAPQTSGSSQARGSAGLFYEKRPPPPARIKRIAP